MIDLLAFMKGDWLEPVAQYIAEHGPVDAAVMRDDWLYLRLPSAWLAYCVPAGVWGAPMLRGAVEGFAVEADEYEPPSRFIGSYSVRIGAYRGCAGTVAQGDGAGRVFQTQGCAPSEIGGNTMVDEGDTRFHEKEKPRVVEFKCPICWATARCYTTDEYVRNVGAGASVDLSCGCKIAGGAFQLAAQKS